MPTITINQAVMFLQPGDTVNVKAVSLRETCQQYFDRRISEGWKCISLEGYNAILLSPEGVRKKLDLRNDVETLSPNGVGAYTNIDSAIPLGPHWQNVDDPPDTPDTDTDVRTDSETLEKDAYELAASSIIAGSTINSVTVYFRTRAASSIDPYKAQPFLWLGGVETAGTEIASSSFNYHTNNEVLARPGGGNWALGDLAALQVCIGLYIYGAALFPCRCTQVYVVVDYTPSPALKNKSANMGSKMIAGKLI